MKNRIIKIQLKIQLETILKIITRRMGKVSTPPHYTILLNLAHFFYLYFSVFLFIHYLNFIGGSSDGVEADRRYDFNYQLFCTDAFFNEYNYVRYLS